MLCPSNIIQGFLQKEIIKVQMPLISSIVKNFKNLVNSNIFLETLNLHIIEL